MKEWMHRAVITIFTTLAGVFRKEDNDNRSNKHSILFTVA